MALGSRVEDRDEWGSQRATGSQSGAATATATATDATATKVCRAAERPGTWTIVRM
jgi:hypothetical protein